MRREQVLHRLGADAPFQCAVDVGIEFLSRKARTLVKRQVQPEEAPRRVLETVELLEERGGQLFAPDQTLERLMHVKRRSHELPGAYGSAIVQLDAGRFAVLDHDAVDIDLRLESAACGDERLDQAPCEIERAALAQLVAALEIKGADNGAHGGGLRERVNEPCAEQRYLEQKQQPHMLVLEQLTHDIERLAIGNLEKFASQGGARQQCLPVFPWQGLGIALRQENLCRDFLGLGVPFAECRRVLPGKSRNIADRFLQVAAQHQR